MAMSVTEANAKACKLKNEESDVTSKPCIDFQPGERWQIQDEPQAEQGNVSNVKSNDLNHTNGQRSRRLRNSKSCDSPVVNGESNDCLSDEEMKVKPDDNVNECDINDSELNQENSSCKRPLEDSDLDDTSEVEKKKIKTGNEQSISPNRSIDSEDVEESNDASSINSDLQSVVETKTDNGINKDSADSSDPVEVIKSDKSESNEAKTNGIENKDLSIEEIKETEKDTLNDDDIEVININDDGKKSDEESDSEIQIINIDAPTPTKIEFPVPSSSDITTSAGFPYYNSLKEAIPAFKAGEYKPVKFPHTGTLLLGDNEVIIESPSLLVPLLIKEADQFPKLEGEEKKINGESMSRQNMVSKRNFFQSSVGQFLINLGTSRVQEWYQRDMKRSKLRQLKSKKPTEEDLEKAISEHDKKHNKLKEINAIFNFRMKQCKFCGFKSESAIVMEGHYLIPHLSPRREFKCNFCMYLSRTIDSIVFHYEALHQKKAVIESSIPFHECIFCSFQSHLKTKVTAHMNRCRKHFFPSQNLAPPFDFEFPGVTTKPVTIADVIGHRRLLLSSAKNRLPTPEDNPNSAYARKKLASVLSKISNQSTYPDMKNQSIVRQLMSPQSNLPPLSSSSSIQLPPGIVITKPTGQPIQQIRPIGRYPPPRPLTNIRAGPIPRRPYSPNLTTTASHLASSGISITPVTRPGAVTPRPTLPTVKNVTLTPIGVASNRNVTQRPGAPQPLALFTNVAGSSGIMGQPQAKFPANLNVRPLRPAVPFQRLSTPPSQVVKGSSGNTFVVCEICDSYVKDLEELRTHMNWVHKVKIHPKMLVSRPPLNCQKCQWRFFTDQGLERHLLGAHGLVTTNMQELANKNQDGGRCIICAAVFTYKLVSHMTQVHKVTLKPAHLSYKCTVCTATFTLYRLFESHVYNVHSGSAKRSAEEPPAEPPPPKRPYEGPRKCKECGYVTENLQDHIINKHMKKCKVKLCRIEKCKKCLYSSDEMIIIRMSDFGLDSDMEDSDDEDDSSEESSEGTKANEEDEKDIG
ncbi:MOG interacting and ectopic P-granules protein 1 [Parasteatoda tepidariorum]|uniref:MOG interacting and ectopic P-granules protein 1 n=1 Tax=Parasteatoda tepidariorum TaxID=114398 RepID=UPI00077FA46D|nr:uncharacterized protein LOC107439591 [Parasteatoda tepidariorum]XP_015907723.1 uncharacterized protein LOC107439591 [Parasteatoda tepidariorum]XP_015907724.1 uncharacterized protein LOC107439591 [Parasteatoda tepidariorum]XP_015907725.1 uncharacterized protein LOC107439591 [Parasteatoda tepidariorum]XP_015907726.1 uncharacterized protein LOC107439591 [Parasteatoda tepidariorum]